MAPRTATELKAILDERNISYLSHPAWSVTEQLAALAPDAAQAAQLKILRELAQEDKPDVDHVAAFLNDNGNAGVLAQAKRAYEKAVGLVTAYNQANEGSRLVIEINGGGLELTAKKRASRESIGRSYEKLYKMLEKDGIESVLYLIPAKGARRVEFQLLSNGQVRYGGKEMGITEATSSAVKENTDRTTFAINAWIACFILDGDEKVAIGAYYDRHVDGEGNIL